MRFLKRTLISVLVYAAVYLPFIAILQAVTGYDFTAAYTIGGASASVEQVTAIITAGGVLAAYILGESMVDANREYEDDNKDE